MPNAYPNRKKPASPKGRRAKFREETPVTRQNEEPNFILKSYCIAQSTTASENCSEKEQKLGEKSERPFAKAFRVNFKQKQIKQPSKQAGTFFEKKVPKKTLLLGAVGRGVPLIAPAGGD